MREYLIRVKGAVFPYLDPEIKAGHMDKNPFGFKIKPPAWTWITPKGKTLWLSPEPPGLQVSFSKTNIKEEKMILKYIQKGIEKETVIIPI